MILDEVNPEIRRSFNSRGWLRLLEVKYPPSAALTREFYSNLSVHSNDSNTQNVRSWIRGEEYVITPSVVVSTFGVPLVQQPMYPYSEIPPMDDIMSYITGTSIQWGTNPHITSYELTELSYLFFWISCHSIWPISHLHTIPIERCAFLYTLVTNAPMVFLPFSLAHLLRFIGVVLSHMVFFFGFYP